MLLASIVPKQMCSIRSSGTSREKKDGVVCRVCVSRVYCAVHTLMVSRGSMVGRKQYEKRR
jgi:hypothetical protein